MVDNLFFVCWFIFLFEGDDWYVIVMCELKDMNMDEVVGLL